MHSRLLIALLGAALLTAACGGDDNADNGDTADMSMTTPDTGAGDMPTAGADMPDAGEGDMPATTPDADMPVTTPDDGGDMPVTPPNLDDPAAAAEALSEQIWSLLICEPLFECPEGASDGILEWGRFKTQEECVAYYAIITPFGGRPGELAASVDAGSVTYDRAAAGECLAALNEAREALTGCARWDILYDDAAGDLEDICEPVFRGTVSPGDACAFDGECADDDDYYCAKETLDACIGVCASFSQECGGCEATEFCSFSENRCVPRLSAGEECFSDVCQEAMFCDYSLETPVCTARSGVGAGCEQDENCLDALFCNYAGEEPVCAARIAIGEPCPEFDGCEEGAFCGSSGAELICRALLEVGSACTSFFECANPDQVACNFASGDGVGGGICETFGSVAQGEACDRSEFCAAGLKCDVDAQECVPFSTMTSPCVDTRDCSDDGSVECVYEFPDDADFSTSCIAQGSLAEGEPCAYSSLCQEELFCNEDGVCAPDDDDGGEPGERTTVTLAGAGEPCGGFGDSSELMWCELGLTCIELRIDLVADTLVGECGAPRGMGGSCSLDVECELGLLCEGGDLNDAVEGTCVPTRSAGEPCTGDEQCASGLCDFDLEQCLPIPQCPAP